MTGRGAALSRLHAAWGRACAGQRQLCWLAGEAGIGKTTLVDHFAASLGPVALRAGPVRRAAWPRRALPARARGAGGAQPRRPVAGHAAAQRRTDLAAAAALAVQRAEREGLRRELAGIEPGPHAARVRRAARPLHAGQAAAAGDRRPALERPRHREPDQPRGAPARHGALDVAGHLPRGRGDRRRPSAEGPAPRTAPAPPGRGDPRSIPFRSRNWPPTSPGGWTAPSGPTPSCRRCTATPTACRCSWPTSSTTCWRRARCRPAPLAARCAPRASMRCRCPRAWPACMERQIQRLPAEQTALLEAASACGVEFRPTVVAQVLEREVDWVAAAMRPAGAPAAVAGVDPGGARREWRAGSTLRLSPCAGPARVPRPHGRPGARPPAPPRRAGARQRAPGAAVSAAELATQFELGQDPDAALPHCAAAAAGALQQFAPADALRLADRGLALGRALPARRAGAGIAGHAAHAARRIGRAGAGRQCRRDPAVVRAGAGRDGGAAAASAAQHGTARPGTRPVPARRTAQARELAERSLAQALQRDDPVLTVAACDLLGQIIKLEGPPREAIAVLEQGIQAAAALDEQHAAVGLRSRPAGQHAGGAGHPLAAGGLRPAREDPVRPGAGARRGP